VLKQLDHYFPLSRLSEAQYHRVLLGQTVNRLFDWFRLILHWNTRQTTI
jgi:hypothetical protein